ncbi:MAG: hypothetical protein JXA23_07650 [Bacteroidales bacterium]|nr:hypothetical protein [Bacteroidales bacterium]
MKYLRFGEQKKRDWYQLYREYVLSNIKIKTIKYEPVFLIIWAIGMAVFVVGGTFLLRGFWTGGLILLAGIVIIISLIRIGRQYGVSMDEEVNDEDAIEAPEENRSPVEQNTITINQENLEMMGNIGIDVSDPMKINQYIRYLITGQTNKGGIEDA